VWPRANPQAICVAWILFLFVYGVASGPLYRTESLRAIIGAEALRGHWLYPVLDGEPFLTKPPGHYAAIAICSLPFGEVTDWSARIPSALAATFTVFLMYRLLRPVSERVAFSGALLIPTSVLWLDKVPSAEIDMTLVFWVTAALTLAVKAHGQRSVGLWALTSLCVAAGTLTKWTAPAFFVLTLIPFLAWRGELRTLLGWRPILAAGLAATLLGAWVLAVADSVGFDTLYNTVRGEFLYRFNPPPKAKGYPWSEVVTYPLLVLAAHLPLSLFALRTLRRSFRSQLDDRAKTLVQFLHCWVWPNLLFWSLVPNHNVRYILPISPALMALGVIGLLGPRFEEPLGPRLRRAVIALLVIWLCAKVVFVEVVVPRRTAGRDAQPTACRLRELVPPGEPLYLFKLKDEGVLFYYGRPAKKLHDPRELPRGAYVALIQSEWDDRGRYGDVQLIQWMYDQQGDPLILVRAN
jgi:4-amino-4-deoxy-L-arabinose transferase-like glycosyltransferase